MPAVLPRLKQALVDPVPEVWCIVSITTILVVCDRFVVTLLRLLVLWQLGWKVKP